MRFDLLLCMPQMVLSVLGNSSPVSTRTNLRTQDRLEASRRRLPSVLAEVDRIVCPAAPTEFTSVLAVGFDGALADTEALASLILQTFRQDTACRCDPFQRFISLVTFNRIISNSWSGIPGMAALYQISVVTHGNPAPLTAFEEDPPTSLKIEKNSTEQTCSVSSILADTMDCPFTGCYCPDSSIAGATSGITEEEFSDSLNASLFILPTTSPTSPPTTSPTSPPTTSPTSPPRSKSSKSKVSKSKSKASNAKTPKSNPPSTKATKAGEKPKKRLLDGSIPGLVGINSVVELQQIEPCDSNFTTFTANLVTFMTTDPCELGEATLNDFIERLIEKYNAAQFEACDFSFRRIISYTFPDICSVGRRKKRERRNLFGGLGGFTFPWNPTVSTSNETTTTGNPGRRRRRLHQDLSVLDSNNDNNKDKMTVVVPRHRNMMSDIRRILASSSLPANGAPLCLCSAFVDGTTDGITEEQFTALANEALLEATNNETEVLDQYEVTTTCEDTGRVDFEDTITVRTLVDTSTLSPADISQLEEDCVLRYNSFIIDQCSEYFYQLWNCTVTLGGSFLLQYNLYGDAGNSTSNIPLRALSGSECGVDRALVAMKEAEEESKDPSTIRGQTLAITTLPEDLCLCRSGVSSVGDNPTDVEFANLINTTGIVAFATCSYCGC